MKGKTDIALIQGTLGLLNQIRGLCSGSGGGTLFSVGPCITPRYCIFVKNTIHTFLLSELCFWDVMTVWVMCAREGSNWELIVTSVYLCCGSDIPPLTDGLRDAIDFYSRNKVQLIIGCGGSAHHIICLEYGHHSARRKVNAVFVGTEPNTLNKVKEPTFVVSNRKEDTVD